MTQKILNFIDGTFVETKNYLQVINPATAEIINEVSNSDTSDIDKAIQAAGKAFPSWSQTSPRERAKILRRIAELIEKKLETLAEIESLNTGKPLRVSKTIDIPRSAYNFEFFADAITQWASDAHPTENKALNYTLRPPLGVVACISPWNLPLYLFTWKVAPALAAGNCVVAKPSEVTPWTAALLGEIANAAGLPKGVLNIIHGQGATAGQALCSHPKVKAISFTGSTRTGAEIAKIAAPQFKKLSLEMGGKNATLVFADCDFDKTVKEVTRAAFSNQGQICLCGSRILVESKIYSQFRDALVKETLKLKVGDPFAPDTDQGSLVSELHYKKVTACLELALQEGGTILCGGKSPQLPGKNGKGYFLEPTLIENLTMNCQTNQEEIFGPVATLLPFESETEAIELANSTRYGLAASLWTQDLSRAHRLAEKIEAGVVWVNTWMLRDLRTPFGGTKNSGVGREGGLEALRFFTETKNICIQY